MDAEAQIREQGAAALAGDTRAALNAAVTRPMIGNEAIARGAWEAGVRVAAAYPGTPSTEIMEFLGVYPDSDVKAQWSTNEKIAMDVAIGGSFAGVRALTAMKHVGLNVASDPLMSQTYIGVNGGLVIVVCDDPGIHSSQNEQDTRLFARFAQVPVLEPSDAQEALDYTRWAFEISERFDTPVILRSTTRLSHTRSPVTTGPRVDPEPLGFNEDPVKNVIIPAHARLAHPRVLEREAKLAAYFEDPEFTRWEAGDTRVGVITVSTSYAYVKEVLPDAATLKLASSYPLPLERIRQFCESVERVIVVEELEPVIETALHAAGIAAEGKAWFPRVGEFSPEVVRESLAKAGVLPAGAVPEPFPVTPTARPPVLCSGCPHTTAYMAVRAVDGRVAGDIGCYTLAAVDPLKAIDTCVSMGSSIGNAVGLSKAGSETRPIIATIGDSTFLHGGIPALIDAVYNEADITVMILDNHIVAMTGGQDHPGTGKTLRGEETHRIDFEEMVRACGVKWVRTIDAYDVASVYQALREAIEHRGVSVVVTNRPCVLDPVKIKGSPLQVRADGCTACQSCMNLGCPSLGWSDEMLDGYHKVTIDESTCIGCTLCAQICPSDCIRPMAV
ncbi:MAG: indolepyruvate ferredoxin oxidoreductase subunit alpha [Rhodospirillales bacterium]|nr:MAG: indolepyruvate ferredoxin oxidoreductase subunit alpha [Rhodospirillales bacterium]